MSKWVGVCLCVCAVDVCGECSVYVLIVRTSAGSNLQCVFKVCLPCVCLCLFACLCLCVSVCCVCDRRLACMSKFTFY